VTLKVSCGHIRYLLPLHVLGSPEDANLIVNFCEHRHVYRIQVSDGFLQPLQLLSVRLDARLQGTESACIDQRELNLSAFAWHRFKTCQSLRAGCSERFACLLPLANQGNGSII
jgi:hypothetical protein